MAGAFLTSDLDAMFSTDDMAIAASYTPAGGSASTLNVIFDHEVIELQFGGIAGALSEQPMIVTQSAKLPAGAKRGDAIVIDGVSYLTQDFKPDGTGVTAITLEKL